MNNKQYYKKPFQKDYEDVYYNGWITANEHIETNGYQETRNSLVIKVPKKSTSLKDFHYSNGYFCAVCQYASDNKLI